MNSKVVRQINEAVAFHQKGDIDNAERLYRAALKQAPRHPDVLHLLGLIHEQRGELAKGIAMVRQALAEQSAFPDAHFNLARMLMAGGDMQGAKTHYERAIALKPGNAKFHNGLGTLYRAEKAYAEATGAFARAIRLDPRFMDAYLNLCSTHRDAADEAALIKVADQGLPIEPNNVQLRLLRGEALFTIGRLAEGWEAYEWRFASKDRPDVPSYQLPLWRGEDIADKGLLVWAEQGVGDEVLYANMLSGLEKRAKHIVLQATPRLAPLLRRSFPNIAVYGGTVPPDALATLAVQTPIGNLGRWIRPTFNAFPTRANYLQADTELTQRLRAKYQAGRPRSLIVGLAWRSAGTAYGREVGNAAEKSVGLNQWGGILAVPGVTFVNLQYGDTSAEVNAARQHFGVDILTDPDVDSLADIDAFAAQVAAMDVVISSSNTAAHVAGALGVPTWCMVPHAAASGRRWYWFGAGEYAPWYASMRLLRQKKAGDWADILADVSLSLTQAAVAAGVLEQPVGFLVKLARGYAGAGLNAAAEKAYDQAAALTPHAGLLAESARLKAARNAIAEAIPLYRRSLEIEPRQAAVHNNLGTALRRLGHDSEASTHYRTAHDIDPGQPSIFLNYATSLFENGQLDAALAAFDQLVAQHPDFVDAHYNRSHVLMALGRFEEGWQAFTWRLKAETAHIRHKDFPQPVWMGENLSDKHVLIWTELGLGEEILSASMAPDAISATRKVTLLCSARLLALFRRSFPHALVDERKTPLPPTATSRDIDVQMSISELGMAFRKDFGAFPARQSYLVADSARRETLRRKYKTGCEDTVLVGISWRSVHPTIGDGKSLRLEQLLPVLRTPGVTFVNLQYGDCRAELDALRRDHGVDIIHDSSIDFGGDMDPVAAQVAAMDRVVSISNTTAHLAGALGVPTWVLLPQGHARLWYWFRGRDVSPWYPRVALMTCGQEGGWSALAGDAAAELKALVENKA
jgi:tetratricopeptide (TPR) repeat protein